MRQATGDRTRRGLLWSERTSGRQDGGRWLNWRGLALLIAGTVALHGCDLTMIALDATKREHQQEVSENSSGGGKIKIGKPYQVAGVWYYPANNPNYDETGIASWYGSEFHGRVTANGEDYDMNALTAAHRTLPMPSYVEVTNLENGRSLILRVNDRGPFVQGRIIDVSRRAAKLLGFEKAGVAKVRVRAVRSGRYTSLQKGPKLAAVPQAEVVSSDLPAPGGVKSVEDKNSDSSAARVRVADAPVRRDAGSVVADGRVTIRDAKPGVLFIQAGAFANFQNANRSKALLSLVGNANITRVELGGTELYRVRVGPLASIPEADKMLQTVINQGFADARIIVD